MSKTAITTIGIDLGKNSFHVIGFDRRGAIARSNGLDPSQASQGNCLGCGCAIGLRVSRDREHGFQRIVSNDFRGS